MSQRMGAATLGKRKASGSGPSAKRFKKSNLTKGRAIRSKTESAGLFKYNGDGPFPNKLATTLLYRSGAKSLTGSAVTGTYSVQFGLNDLFDFDITNVMDNKQPLYYDTLFTATGPYTRMETKAWRTRLTVINLGAEALSIYWNGKGTAIGSSEEDSLAEVTNRPGQQAFHLGPKGSSMDRIYIRSFGKWEDHNTEESGTAQSYNASPSTIIYGSLFASTPSTNTAPTFVLQVDHFFDVICTRPDATQS